MMKSVVLKPIAQFDPKPTVRFPKSRRSPTLRQAVALVATAAANGVSLANACTLSRRVTVDGVDGFVENGVCCDILTSDLAAITSARDPADEQFSLTADQVRTVVGLVGPSKCIDLGVLPVT